MKGYVYLIEADQLRRYKIGRSKNPLRRFNELSGSQSCAKLKLRRSVKVADMEAVEKSLHQQFDRYRLDLGRSTEWFEFPDAILEHQVLPAYDRLSRKSKLPNWLVLILILLLGFTAVALLQRIREDGRSPDFITDFITDFT